MDIFLYDKDFNLRNVVDVFKSFIWTERFDSIGDFELMIPATPLNISMLLNNMFLAHAKTKRIAILDTIQLLTDKENGNYIIQSGRFIEDILKNRIIWDTFNFEGSVNSCIKAVLNKNVINPENSKRKIEVFIYKDTDANEKIRIQSTGDTVYNFIKKVCLSFGYGFKIELENKQLYFSLYKGKDYSISQETNPRIMFSHSNENLISSKYLNSIKNEKNVILVAGEGEGKDRKRKEFIFKDASGLFRKELFVDARDISSKTEDGGNIKITKYNELLERRAKEKILEHNVVSSFDGHINPYGNYMYGKDYFLGDLVTIKNEFNMQTNVIIKEYIESYNEKGKECYPTFEEKGE